MDKAPDFGRDLATLNDNVSAEVEDVLQVLRQKRTASRKVVFIKEGNIGDESPTATDVPSLGTPEEGPELDRTHGKRATVQARAKSKLSEKVVKDRFTTRLAPMTKELLEEAKNWQRLKKVAPDDYEDIVDEALQDWFKKNGYAR